MLLVACERTADTKSDSKADMAADTTAVMSARVSGGVSDSVSAARPACAPTGLWKPCSVFERLDRSGLAPIRDSATVVNQSLTPRGERLTIGRGELELYIYESASAREAEQARLDASKYVVYPAPLPMQPVPTLVTSANLIAILHTRNDHLRERVSDAITAGPPQPPKNPTSRP